VETVSSLPHSQVPATCPYPGFCVNIPLQDTFYDEELLAPHPTPKLKDHPLSAVRDCLFNIFATTLHIGGRSSIRNPRTRHAVVTGTHLSQLDKLHVFKSLSYVVHFMNIVLDIRVATFWVKVKVKFTLE
jgi:hypothetical protein